MGSLSEYLTVPEHKHYDTTTVDLITKMVVKRLMGG
jgi:hypothetical protein